MQYGTRAVGYTKIDQLFFKRSVVRLSKIKFADIETGGFNGRRPRMTNNFWTRRELVGGMISAAAISTWPSIVKAEIAAGRIVVGFPAGGVVDVLARRIADALQGGYAKSMIVDNKTGAGGQIAVVDTMRSAPDGSSLLYSPGAILTIYPHTFKKLPYNTTDVLPVCMAGTFISAIAVGPSVPDSVKNVKDLLSWIKANPSQASYGSPAAGSTVHFLGALLSQASGVNLQHVAYRGTQPALLDLIAGRIPIVMSTQGEFIPMAKAGSLRILAVATSTRSKALPDVPTLIEQGFPNLVAREFMGFYLPQGASETVVQTANAALKVALATPAVQKSMEDLGVEPSFSSPSELAQLIKTEYDYWGAIVKRIGFSAD
jgi:tripartite-type tricarboxylate transporter receptor subunit TctC